MTAPRLTVRDIARKAQVSPTTVSLILNNKADHISEKTRNLVLEIAEKYKYRPNRVAVSLATKRTKTLGVIVPSLTNLFYTTMVSGIESFAQEQEYTLLLSNCSNSTAKCINLISVLEDQCIDGLILIPPSNVNENDQHIQMKQALARFRAPYILMEHAIHDLYHDFVTSDNKLGGYIATKHLLDLGHRKIGCITGPFSEYGAMRRLAGYRDALEASQIMYDENLVYEGDFTITSGKAGMEYLAASGITAVFSSNDLMAHGALHQAEILGISVPEQLSIVGYDNNPIAEILKIPLTTVAQPIELMGKNACEVLIAKINEDSEVHQDYYFRPFLIERKSTAPPPPPRC